MKVHSKKHEELAYCKASILLIAARALDTLIATAGLAAQVPMDGLVWAAVRYARLHTFRTGVGELLPNGKIRDLRVELSQREFLARPLYPDSAPTIFRIAPRARIALLDCSRNGFRKAHVRIETDSGEWRQLEFANRDLEITAKSLHLVRVPDEQN